MKKTILGLSFICLPLAYSMPARVNPDVGSFLNIGRGYDMVSGNTAANCIVPQDPKPVSGGVAEVSAHLRYIKDYESLAKSLEISSSTHVKIGMPAYKFNLDATSKFFSELKIDETSLYFMVEISIKMPMEQISKVRIDEDYKKLLEGDRGVEEFRDVCGDEFVDAIQKGGKLYGLVQIKTRSEEDRRQIELVINGKLGKSFSTGLSLRQNLMEITTNHAYELFFSQVGGVAENLPLSLDGFDELFKQAQEFSKKVAVNEAGVIILASTVSYKQAINYPRGVSPIRAADKVNTVEKYSQFRFHIIKTLHYLDSVVMNPDDYEPVDERMFEKINKIRDQYLRNMEIINEFADNCFYDIKDCKVPASTDGFILYESPKIKRKDGRVAVENPSTVKRPEEEVCIKYLYNEKSGSVCGLADIKRGTGEVCGVESYNIRTDSRCGTMRDYIKQEYDPGYRNCLPGRENMPVDQSLLSRYFPENEWECYRGGDQSICQNRGSGHWWILCKGEVAKTCRRAEFGVEKYKECLHPSFGVTYNTCRHESFGLEKCLEWKK
jgi:hypothetical protein